MAQLSLATATGVPEFMLSPEQTQTLAAAAQKVSRHFPSVLTQKQQDIVMFVGALGTIGYQQTQLYFARKAQEKAAKAGTVVPFTQHN